LAIATAVVFIVSSAFPVAAGLTQDTSTMVPIWGVLDVAIAFVLVMMAFTLTALARGRVTKEVEGAAYRAYRVLIHAIFLLIVIFFLFGGRINWTTALIGVGWRFWLLLYILPSWISLMGSPRDEI
jgi:hypothetical protein